MFLVSKLDGCCILPSRLHLPLSVWATFKVRNHAALKVINYHLSAVPIENVLWHKYRDGGLVIEYFIHELIRG